MSRAPRKHAPKFIRQPRVANLVCQLLRNRDYSVPATCADYYFPVAKSIQGVRPYSYQNAEQFLSARSRKSRRCTARSLPESIVPIYAGQLPGSSESSSADGLRLKTQLGLVAGPIRGPGFESCMPTAADRYNW
jgi:hypothetical protein